LRRTNVRKAFGLAGFAALGFVTKLLIVEEKLFARGEDKITATIDALQSPILELHASSWLRCCAENTNAQARFLAPLIGLLPWVRPDRTGKCADLLGRCGAQL